MANDSTASGGIRIDPNMPFLSGADLMKEARGLPAEIVDLGNGVSVERRGIMIKVVGGENLSPAAFRAAIQAADMGGGAGRTMFETYRKTHPEDFDGSRTFSAILAAANAPPPPAQGPAEDDYTHRVPSKESLDAEESATGVTVQGGSDVEIKGSPEDDFIAAYNRARLWGREGDDTLRASNDSTLNGGDGNDVLSAYHNSTLYGGTGDDILKAYGSSLLDGGEGNDRLEAYNDADMRDDDGDNFVSAYRRSNVTTGGGSDWIETYDHATVRADNGDNMVTAYDHSIITTGAGQDSVSAGGKSTLVTGAGNDLVSAGRGSHVDAGTGDDRITVKGEATIRFARGDGNDILGGGRWGHAYRETDHLSSSTITFEQGITAADLSFQARGNDLYVAIDGGADSITLRDYQRHGILSMTFADGTALSADDIATMVGPGEAYKPVSQVLQRWHDATAAYQATQEKDGTIDRSS